MAMPLASSLRREVPVSIWRLGRARLWGLKGRSWSAWRKRTRPFDSSTRLGCWGLKAWSGGMGMFFQGCEGAVAVRGAADFAGASAGAAWASEAAGERVRASAAVSQRFGVIE